MYDNVADSARQPRPDARQILETGSAVLRENLRYGNGQLPKRRGGAAIGAHAVGIGRLLGKQCGNLVETLRDIVVLPRGHARLAVPIFRDFADGPSPSRRNRGDTPRANGI